MTENRDSADASLLLIDGHSLAYRAYHALPPESFTTSTGQTTNAVFGFLSMLVKALEQEAPTHLAVAFDLGRQTFRLAEYPEYKAGRSKTPDDFHGQVELIKDVLGAMRIPVVVKEGVEADDVLATLAARAAESGLEARIITGDKDSFQLVRDGVTVLYPKRGVSDLQRMTPAAVEEKYGVSPANYRGLAALVGEKADNLPGVPGVGEKTAAKWLTAHGDLPGVLAAADDIGGKVGERLREHLDDVERNYRLNRLLDDLDLDVSPADAERAAPDSARLSALLDQLEFAQLGPRIEAASGADAATSAPSTAPAAPEVTRPAAGELAALLAAAEGQTVGVETDGTYVRGLGAVDGIGVAFGETALAVDPAELTEEDLSALGALLARGDGIVLHDAKTQAKALAAIGFTGVRASFDTELAAYLLKPDARGYALDSVAEERLGWAPPVDDEDGQAALDLDGTGARSGLGIRAWTVLRLAEVLEPALEAAAQTAILTDIELPVQSILGQMEMTGIAVDAEALSGLISEFGSEAEASAQAAYAAIGREVNLGSPKQLQEVLFDDLGMPKTKRTKTGYTTDAEALADLLVRTGHPFLEHLLAHRDRTKLRQTVVGLEKSLCDDGRIRTTYLQTVAATGRLSSKDPNLQNIPVRTEAGRRIREVFVPGSGFESLMTVDYSQIEMRIMAHLSGDDSLIEAFCDGEDLHAYVGSQIFGVPPDEVTPEMRAKVKAMSYGLVYGLSAFGLARQLRIGVDEARALMDGYFERFGAVRDYLSGVVEEARTRGYTETMDGRRRYLPGLTSDRRQVREMAERAALNAPIQGSAADIVKRAMILVDEALGDAGMSSRVLLQVHDEIVLEVAPGEAEALGDLVREEMGRAAELRVPLAVSAGTGANWQAAAH